MQQHGKGKAKALEPLECNWCIECGLKCKLRPGKLISYMKCCKAKAKCEQLSKEKLEMKCKQAQAEEPEAGPNGLKRPKKMSEERSDWMVELAEVLRVGLKGITDALSK